jgi:hypothetical protein
MRTTGGLGMTRFSKRNIQLIATLILGASLGGALLLTFAGAANTNGNVSQTASVATDRCAGGTDVSRFVCRNGWMAFTKYGAR